MSDRHSVRAEYHDVVETRRFPTAGIELREVANGTGGTVLNFEGYACVTGQPYTMADAVGEYDETVARGAFARTLGEGPDVAFLVNHAGISLARTKAGTLDLAEDSTGLLTRARLDPRSATVQELRLAVDAGNLDASTSTIYEDRFKRVLEVRVTDYETNTSYAAEVTVEKTTATIAEYVTLDDTPTPNRYIKISTNSLELAGTVTTCYSEFYLPMRLYSVTDGEIANNANFHFTYKGFYDPTLTYAIKAVVLNSLSALP